MIEPPLFENEGKSLCIRSSRNSGAARQRPSKNECARVVAGRDGALAVRMHRTLDLSTRANTPIDIRQENHAQAATEDNSDRAPRESWCQ
jgi:hypothetical protein